MACGVNSCANSDAVEFGLALLLDVSLGSDRAVAQRVDFSFLVGFGSVDVVVTTGPGLALTVCLSEGAFARCQLPQMHSDFLMVVMKT